MQDHTEVTALNMLDTVALVEDMPSERLVKGQVGTVVEELAEGVYEVEFTNRQGETISSLALSVDRLMLLHFEMEAIT